MFYMLWFKGVKLQTFKLFGKPNALVGLFLKNPETGMYIELGRTECKSQCDNPDFSIPIIINRKHMKINLPKKQLDDHVIEGCFEKTKFIALEIFHYFQPEEEEITEETFQNLKFLVCDIDFEKKDKVENEHIVGWCECRYDDISEQTTSLPIVFGTRVMGSLLVTPEVTDVAFLKQIWCVKVEMSGVPHPSIIWFRFSRSILGSTHFIYSSDFSEAHGEKDVEWNEFEISYAVLCNGDDDAPILFELMICNVGEQRILKANASSRLGHVTITPRQLMNTKEITLTNSIVIKVAKFSEKE